MGGARFFLSIIDDYSRKVWTYLLKSKDKTFRKFLEWKTLVEKQMERKVKHLRMDNGLEFFSNEFKNFCNKEGINRHLTMKEMPQQNGLVERMNRTLLEKVRCLMSNACLPKSFWREALMTATYLINRSPSSAIHFKTSVKKWFKHPPNLSNLKVFGCIVYAHVREEKLDKRAKKCLSLGYPFGVKLGYRLWCIGKCEEKCIISRHVTFDESKIALENILVESSHENVSKETYEMKLELPLAKRNCTSTQNINEINENVQTATDANESTATQTKSVVLPNESVVETLEHQSLQNYNLTHDRKRRVIRPPTGYEVLI